MLNNYLYENLKHNKNTGCIIPSSIIVFYLLCNFSFFPCRSKEVNLPYPQEHPYSSHIPHYNTFPDPYPHPPSLRTNPPLTPQPHHLVTPPSQLPTTALDYQENTIEIQQADQPDTIQQDTIQHDEQPKTPFVDHLPCNPPHPHYVERKASDFGMRIESMDLKWNNDPMGKMPEIEHLLWQLPKGYTHKVRRKL